ncbi:hypothetical protein IGI43_000593 [Enterococcus sp. AZ126]
MTQLKLKGLVENIMETQNKGLGKPEPLKVHWSGY